MPIEEFRASVSDVAVETTFNLVYPRMSLFTDIRATALIGDFWFTVGATRLFRYEINGVIEQINISGTISDPIAMIGANDNLLISELGGG